MTIFTLISIIPIDMSKFKFAFTNIFLWLGIISSCLLIENHAFLTATPTDKLPDVYFFMLFALALSSYVVLYIFEHVYNKTKVDLILVGILSILLTSGVLAIWLFKDINFFPDDPSKVISLSYMERIRLSIGYGMFILTTYSILFIFNKNRFSLRSLRFIFIILIGIVYFLIIYSLTAEMPAYISLFRPDMEVIPIESLFWNSNVFAGTLLMGICAAIVLNIVKKNVFSYISIFIFYIEIFLNGSILAIIVATVGIFVYFLVEIFLSMKKHTARSFIFLGVLLLSTVLLICLFALSVAGALGSLSRLLGEVYFDMVRFDYSTFNRRVMTWTYVIQILSGDPLKMAFGCGYDVCNTVINSKIASCLPDGTTSIVSAHNGIMQILLCNGIVGVVIYGLFLFYFIYACIKMMKHDKRFSWLYLTVGMIMLAYSFGESIIFFNCNVQGILVGIAFYLPVIMRYRHIKYSKVRGAIFAIPYNNFAIDNRRVAKITGFFIMSLICTLSPILFMESVRYNALLFKYLLMVEACLIIAWIFLPYLVCQWHKDTKLKHFKLRFTLNLLFIVVLFSGTYILYYIFDVDYNANYVYAIPAILCGVLLIDAIYYSIIRKPSFKDFASPFVGFVQMSIQGALVSVGGTILLLHFYQSVFDNGLLIYIIVAVFSLLVYYAINLLIMSKEMKYNVEYMNNIYLTFVKRQYLLENTPRKEKKKNVKRR